MIADGARIGVDRFGVTGDEMHAHCIEQLTYGGLQRVCVGLVEARANVQFRLRREHADAQVVALGLVE